MVTFTVTLPTYNTTVSFDTTRFTQLFPDSVITLALQSGENDIPLENPLVTPYILELLQTIVISGLYHYIPDSVSTRRALDYLNIDLPEPVYYPQYQEIMDTYPYVDLTNFNPYVRNLGLAVQYQFPEWVRYIFDHTNSREHQKEDYDVFRNILQSRSLSKVDYRILRMLIRDRGVIGYFKTKPFDVQQDIVDRIIEIRSPDVFETFIRADPSMVTEYSIGNKILRHIVDDPEHYTEYYQLMERLGPYLPKESGQVDSYDLLRAAANGDQKTIDTTFSERLVRSAWIDYLAGPIVIYTALIQGHYQVAKDLLDRYIQYIRYNPALNRAKEWVRDLITLYLSHMDWITPEGLQVFLNGINSISELAIGQRDYRSIIRGDLAKAGYTDLAKLIP